MLLESLFTCDRDVEAASIDRGLTADPEHVVERDDHITREGDPSAAAPVGYIPLPRLEPPKLTPQRRDPGDGL